MAYHFRNLVFEGGGVKGIAYMQHSSHLHSDDWARTVYIDTLGVSTTDFSLPEARKKELVRSGRKGALKYFAWYDNTDVKPNK